MRLAWLASEMHAANSSTKLDLRTAQPGVFAKLWLLPASCPRVFVDLSRLVVDRNIYCTVGVDCWPSCVTCGIIWCSNGAGKCCKLAGQSQSAHELAGALTIQPGVDNISLNFDMLVCIAFEAHHCC